MERITDYLVEDHDRMHLLLAEACAGTEVDLIAYHRFRAMLLRHIAIEEKLLFPEVRALSRRRELRLAHAEIAGLLAREPDLASCGQLAYLLGQHDALEEGPGGVYAECERMLGAERSDELARAARAYGEVRVAPFRSILRA